MVLLGTAAFSMSLSQPKQYTAEAALLFRDPAFDQKLFGSTFLGGSRDPDREAATNVALVGMKQVARRTAARADIDLTAKEVQAAVVVAPDGRSDVVTVRTTLDDPSTATAVANAFATEFVSIRREADRRTIFNAQRLVDRQLADIKDRGDLGGSRANSLRERGEELSVLGSLQTGNAELVQRAEPPAGPSGPRPKRNAAIGLLLGLLLGIGAAFLRDRLDRRLRTLESLEQAFDRPILARIPLTDTFKGGFPPARSPAEEAFSALWTNLRYFNVTSGIESVLVTSPTSGDGKSTVALNLAAAAARSGSSVLLVETDLRRPSLAGVIARSPQSNGARPRRVSGLTQVLAGVIPFERAVIAISVADPDGPRGDRKEMDVLLAGPIPPNPAEMLDSSGMRELLVQAREHYDLVVLDTPPPLVVPDPVPLLGQVSAVLAVGRLGTITRDSVSALRSQLTMLDAPLVGVVANCTPEVRGDYYYQQASDSAAVDPVGSAPAAVHD